MKFTIKYDIITQIRKAFNNEVYTNGRKETPEL